MGLDDKNSIDIEEILSHRYENGSDYYSTADINLLKHAPFTTLESVTYLLELGMKKDNPFLKGIAGLILDTSRDDGRFKVAPTNGMYPCHVALALNQLCKLGYTNDKKVQKSFKYFLDTQEKDGGWKCNKYSFGRGEETNFSTPITTLIVLDAFRDTKHLNSNDNIDKAVEFLLKHWEIKKPISPCHYGIGTRFMQIEYPFIGYNLFYYVYVLSFYDYAKKDKRFIEAFNILKSKLIDDMIVVERVVPKLAKLNFCRKNEPSELATKKYREILKNLE